jgi:hypothetical protein
MVGRWVGGVGAARGRVFSPVAPGCPKLGFGVRGRDGANSIGTVVVGRRGPREALALVVGNEVAVGQTALVQFGAFLANLSLGPLPGRLLLGNPSPALGDLGALVEVVGRLTMLGGRGLAPLAQLAFASPQTSAATQTRERRGERDDNKRDDDYDDDQTCGHSSTSLQCSSGLPGRMDTDV